MIITSEIIIIILCIIILISLIINIVLYRKNKTLNINDNTITNEQKFFVENFNNIIICLEYFYEKTYFIIYQKHILSYVASGYTIDEETNINLNKEFVNNLFEIMGKNYINLFSNFFGDLDTFINNSLIYFNNQLINKDIKESINNNTIFSENENE